ncbi:MAG: hypothetical protein EXR07_18765 [Acetobacteraceae bacterium]|nr:hypothetical protein [Acetobacteraceae bacterium]
MRLIAAARGYAASDDPRVAAANLVALVLAWNTPFYPLYLRVAAGPEIWPGGWLTLCVFPVFLSVPAATRQWPLGGRVFLLLAAMANTMFCTWILGEASGTSLFLLPSVTLAALVLGREERVALVSLLALPILAGVALHGRYPVSPFVCSGAACGGIVWLNAVSVAVLAVFLGWLATGMVNAAAAPTLPPTQPRR